MPRRIDTDVSTDVTADTLLDDLELRMRNDLSAARDLSTQRTKMAITIRPGNLIDRQANFLLGTTTELRRGGVSCLTTQPIMVGNIFHLAFDREHTNLNARLAVCDRCTMLGEASFELRFQFVQAIELRNTGNGPTDG